MSHRKFEHPRNGSLGFLPRKRTNHHHGRIRAFPKDVQSAKPHFTAFMGYKAGMTHVLRDAKIHGIETIDPVTIIETPPMIVCGIVGYTETPKGLRALTTVWAQHLDDSMKRIFYKNWYRCKGKAFDKYAKTNYIDAAGKTIERDLARIKKFCSVVRVLAHTQVQKLHIGRKKAHMMEIQINGGTVDQKVDFGYSFFEQPIAVDTVFSKNDMVDLLGVTKGKGFEGVISRWGVTALPRKTHRGLRKVACIGSWHPARIGFTVPRPGQQGYHHRTEINKKIFSVGKAAKPNGSKTIVNYNATTPADLTEKVITPMGGFPQYSDVNEDFLMIKGGVVGARKRPITIRKSLLNSTKRSVSEDIEIKFIDTSSKMGKGRFQTSAEKAKHYNA